MIKFYYSDSKFYLDIDGALHLLPREKGQPILVGGEGSEKLLLQDSGLPLTAISSIYDESGQVAYTLDTLLPLLREYSRYLIATTYLNPPCTMEAVLTPSMQESEDGDKPITFIHINPFEKVDVRCEDEDGVKFEPDSFIQNIYETVGGKHICTKTKFWFSGTNKENYNVYFTYKNNINY